MRLPCLAAIPGTRVGFERSTIPVESPDLLLLSNRLGVPFFKISFVSVLVLVVHGVMNDREGDLGVDRGLLLVYHM